MRPILRPAILDLLPIGTLHGTSATNNDFIVNGYSWRIEGNRPEPWSVLGAGGPYEQDAGGYINDLTAFLLLTFPMPTVCNGINFNCPPGFSNSDSNAQVLFEGLDRTADPNGIWRTLAPPATLPGAPGVPGGGTLTVNFTIQAAIEQMRISSANATNPTYTFARGFRFGKILSLF